MRTSWEFCDVAAKATLFFIHFKFSALNAYCIACQLTSFSFLFKYNHRAENEGDIHSFSVSGVASKR
jgi:hypothetical protein